MENYHYRALSSDCASIRLLRLLPDAKPFSEIRCELFEYTVQPSSRPHLYEALSYVWGDSENRLPIVVNDRRLFVTKNLHAALLHLRNHSLDRVLWIDAVCINQEDDREKEKQIQYMGRIYAQANRVIVWLGEPRCTSDTVLEDIRAAAEGTRQRPSSSQRDDILTLLSRPWFRRIWVLQEVAAARQISIMYGLDEIDGYTFCQGLDKLSIHKDDSSSSQNYLGSTAQLMRGAVFRPRNRDGPLGKATLGQLLDTYHTYEATKWHDKVYALLGMSSDNPSPARLAPNYTISWPELFQELVRFLLSERVTVRASKDGQLAAIKGKGYFLGTVVSIKPDKDRWDVQHGQIAFLSHLPTKNRRSLQQIFSKWSIPALNNPIQAGDHVCYLQEAQRPTAIRTRKDSFKVIMISPILHDDLKEALPRKNSKYDQHHLKDILLIWDWSRIQETPGHQAELRMSETINALYPEDLENITIGADRCFEMGRLAKYLGDPRANENFLKAKAEYKKILGNGHPQVVKVLEELRMHGMHSEHYHKAEDCAIEVVQIQKRQHGKDHKIALESKANLAKCFVGRHGIRRGGLLNEVIYMIRQKQKPDFLIPEQCLIEAAGRSCEGLFILLLDMKQELIPITEKICEAAVGNDHCGDKLVTLLLEERGGDIQVTQNLVEVALENRAHTGTLLELLFTRKASNFAVTEDMWLCAVSRSWEPLKIGTLLYSYSQSHAPITGKVIVSAAFNGEGGKALVNFLLEQGCRVTITLELIDNLVNYGERGRAIMAVLLNHLGKSVDAATSLTRPVQELFNTRAKHWEELFNTKAKHWEELANSSGQAHDSKKRKQEAAS